MNLELAKASEIGRQHFFGQLILDSTISLPWITNTKLSTIGNELKKAGLFESLQSTKSNLKKIFMDAYNISSPDIFREICFSLTRLSILQSCAFPNSSINQAEFCLSSFQFLGKFRFPWFRYRILMKNI